MIFGAPVAFQTSLEIRELLTNIKPSSIDGINMGLLVLRIVRSQISFHAMLAEWLKSIFLSAIAIELGFVSCSLAFVAVLHMPI